MVYNCMAATLDSGVGNVTAALRAASLWDETLLIFSADNGGWAADTGSNNFPLRGLFCVCLSLRALVSNSMAVPA